MSFVCRIYENVFFFSHLLVQKLFFDKSHCFQLLSIKIDWIMSLFLISVTLHSLFLNHSIMISVGKEASFSLRWKLYCYSSPSHLTRENLLSRSVFCFSFIFFVSAFWPLETTTASLQGLTHSNLAKSSYQVTLVTNIWIISFGRKVNFFTTA